MVYSSVVSLKDLPWSPACLLESKGPAKDRCMEFYRIFMIRILKSVPKSRPKYIPKNKITSLNDLDPPLENEVGSEIQVY